MADLSVTLCGLKLDNPVIPASGTFGYGREFSEIYDLNILGAFVFKGTTSAPRLGNPPHRIAETPGGMLNAIGLQNPGLDAVLREELPEMAGFFSKPVIANVGGFSEEEYAENCRRLDAQPQVGILEVNISCPNVHAGGRNFSSSAADAQRIIRAVKAVTAKPVFAKLSPNVTDIAEIAKACEAAGADGISLINTLLGMRIDLVERRPVLANVYGGLSGPAIFPVALRMVHEVAKAVGVPIMGMGGVSSARDVVEMMMAGATAVQIGAANLVNPYVCKEIIEQLPQVMEDLGIARLADMIGVVS